MKTDSCWQWKEVSADTWTVWNADQLELKVRQDHGELISRIAYHRGREQNISCTQEDYSGNGNLPAWEEGTSGSHYLIGRKTRVCLKPVLPDRPLVLKPVTPRKIPPGSKVQLVFFIPVWLQLLIERNSGEFRLDEYPARVLSSTWFGEMQSGELCYTLDTELYQDVHKTPEYGYLAACMLNIQNNSHSLLDFSRMAVHVEHLSLFKNGTGLFTNEVSINFNGVEQISQVKYSPRGPREIEGLRKISGPRLAYSNNLLKRSFSFFRQLTEI